ncbi:hypothetical protein MT356_10890 [Rathayibacter festucae]|uniref:hypothetical protein n=1 Tax=Rathayibacter festucae TaxID=110937 RepID=UPI001FB52FC6|nr:hypothetical protein [Rathayibacter festucae]MCJ1700225.1 hypothetical protein [Rathayibacter festucae]
MTDLATSPPPVTSSTGPGSESALEARLRIIVGLAQGASESQLADELELAPDVVHEHLRGVLVQLSPELLAMVAHPELTDGLDGLYRAVRDRGGDEQTLAALLTEQTALLSRHRSPGGGLARGAADFLVESGSMTAEELAETEAEVARGELADRERRTRLQAIVDSFGTAEVASRLRIDETRVRHRKAKDGLYAFKVGSKLRFPAWQFTDDRERPMLPGVPALVKAIPEDMHPASVLGFMTTPQEELLIGETPVTPVRWLSGGGDPREVLVALAEFDEP